jgi:hypothetical protein
VAGDIGPAGSVPAGQLDAQTGGKLILSTGLRGLKAAIMLAISHRESSFNSQAHNTNASTGDNSYGLFQINMIGALGPARLQQFNIASNDELLDPVTAVRCMYIHSSNGTNFSPWYIDANTGAATTPGYDLTYLDQAKQVIAQLGGGT